MISGSTTLIAHIGYPTETFKAPLIYNPYFEKARIDAVVVPMGVKAGDYRDFLKSIFRLTNIRGALITMPHKVTTVGLLDECSTAVKVAGSCNAILRIVNVIDSFDLHCIFTVPHVQKLTADDHDRIMDLRIHAVGEERNRVSEVVLDIVV